MMTTPDAPLGHAQASRSEPESMENCGQITRNDGVQGDTLECRFGTLNVGPETLILFPRGILGFPDSRSFALTTSSMPHLKAFHILQSLDDTSVGFLLVNLTPLQGVLEPLDVQSALAELLGNKADQDTSHPTPEPANGCTTQEKNNLPQGVKIFGIVSVRSPSAEGEMPQITVNLRAPIIVDTLSKEAWQHIFINPAYAIQHPLSELTESINKINNAREASPSNT